MLPLPISPADALAQIIAPGLALLPKLLTSRDSKVMLLAIALQESGLKHRIQIMGPARGLWQFERIGVAGVLEHAASRVMALEVCEGRGVVPEPRNVHDALARDDLLACAFARLNLFTDPRPLPRAGETAAAWATYKRVWRPGKPHLHRWQENYPLAVQEVA